MQAFRYTPSKADGYVAQASADRDAAQAAAQANPCASNRARKSEAAAPYVTAVTAADPAGFARDLTPEYPGMAAHVAKVEAGRLSDAALLAELEKPVEPRPLAYVATPYGGYKAGDKFTLTPNQAAVTVFETADEAEHRMAPEGYVWECDALTPRDGDAGPRFAVIRQVFPDAYSDLPEGRAELIRVPLPADATYEQGDAYVNAIEKLHAELGRRLWAVTSARRSIREAKAYGPDALPEAQERERVALNQLAEVRGILASWGA